MASKLVTTLRSALYYNEVYPRRVFDQVKSRKTYVNICDQFNFHEHTFAFIKLGVEAGYHKALDQRVPGGGGIFLGPAVCEFCRKEQNVTRVDVHFFDNLWRVRVSWVCRSNECSAIRASGAGNSGLGNSAWGINTLNAPKVDIGRIDATAMYLLQIRKKEAKTKREAAEVESRMERMRQPVRERTRDDWTLQEALADIEDQRRLQEMRDRW